MSFLDDAWSAANAGRRKLKGVEDGLRAEVRAEAAEGVKPYVMLAIGLSLLALYRSSRRRR